MIGNVTFARDKNELNSLIGMRNQYFTNCIINYAAKGIMFKPHKLKIIVVNDMSSDNCNSDFIIGSILLPNSRAMFALIEGDYNTFIQEYYNKLETDKDIQEYLIVLLAGLVDKEFDYVFYFDCDDPSMYNAISNALMNYLYQKFGITAIYTPVVLSNPNLFLSQSIIPERIMMVQNLIQQYKLSSKPSGLFNQY